MRKTAEDWIEFDLIETWGKEAQIEVLSGPNDILLLTAETYGVSLFRFTKSDQDLWTSNWISTISTDDQYSESLAVSPNKQWAAFGAGAVSTSEHYRAGAVNVFQVTDSTMTQLGETIRGDTLAAYLGESVAISDGGRLFAGAPQHGQLAQYYPYTQGKGRVEVYDWNTDDVEWQRTSLIHGLTWPERQPGGLRNPANGSFANGGWYGYWWTTTLYENGGLSRFLGSFNPMIEESSPFPQSGFSVRCIKD